jgi:hypothetical protein
MDEKRVVRDGALQVHFFGDSSKDFLGRLRLLREQQGFFGDG